MNVGDTWRESPGIGAEYGKPAGGRLREYAANFTSQCGEDGMIGELLRRLRIQDGWAVEFGAWDGKYLSNTHSLWHDRGWAAVLIEGNEMLCEELRFAVSAFDRVQALHAWVSDTGQFALDNLLSEAGVPPDFELLSVDIDGDDYDAWAGLKLFKPKIVVIEYNESFPPHISYSQPRGRNCGSSALAFCELAEEKGYVLVDLTPTNLIFIRGDLKPEPAFVREPLSSLFIYEDLIFAWSDMGGRIHLEAPGMWGFRPPVRLSQRMRHLKRQSIVKSARRTLTLAKRALTFDRRLYANGLRLLTRRIHRRTR